MVNITDFLQIKSSLRKNKNSDFFLKIHPKLLFFCFLLLSVQWLRSFITFFFAEIDLNRRVHTSSFILVTVCLSQARRNSQSDAVALQAIRNAKGNNFCVDCDAPSKSCLPISSLIWLLCLLSRLEVLIRAETSFVVGVRSCIERGENNLLRTWTSLCSDSRTNVDNHRGKWVWPSSIWQSENSFPCLRAFKAGYF